jgi:hypothetical protein
LKRINTVPDHPLSPEVTGAKKFYLFEGLLSIDYGDGDCHRDQSSDHIIYGMSCDLSSKRGERGVLVSELSLIIEEL